MDTIAHLLQSIHTTNSWLVLIAGCVAAGMLLVETIHHGTIKRGGLALCIFAFLVYLQVVLGIATTLVKNAANEGLFGGNTDKAFWHAVLGISAAVLVTLSVWMRRKNWRIATMIATVIALFAPNLGRLIPLLLILAVCCALAEVVWRRSRHLPLSTSQPNSKERP